MIPAALIQIPAPPECAIRLSSRLVAIALAVTLAVIFATGVAEASKLDEKWTESRTQANELAAAAREGDERALGILLDFAEAQSAPAIHNVGWLHKNGIPALGIEPDLSRACGSFDTAARHRYPPAIHQWALCQFAFARDETAPDKQRTLVRRGLGLLETAAKAGWTPSALQLAHHHLQTLTFTRADGFDALSANQLLKFRRLDGFTAEERRTFAPSSDVEKVRRVARRVATFAELGLATDPNERQRDLLANFLGLAAVLGDGIAGARVDDLLEGAVGRGHPSAGAVQAAQRRVWEETLEGLGATALGLVTAEEPRCFGAAGAGRSGDEEALAACRETFRAATATHERILAELSDLDRRDAGGADRRHGLRQNVWRGAADMAARWQERFFDPLGETP